MTSPTDSGVLRQLFWPVYAPTVLFGTAAAAVFSVQVLALLQFGAPAATATALIALVGILAVSFSMPAGVLVDRVGEPRAIAYSTVIVALFLTLSGVALMLNSTVTFGIFVAAMLLRVPAMAVWNLARQVLVATAIPAALRGRAMTGLGGSQRAGALLGPLCAAGLLLILPLWSVYFFAATCVAAAYLCVTRAPVPDKNRFAGEPAGQSATNSAARSADTESANDKVRWSAVLIIGCSIMILSAMRVLLPVLLTLLGVALQLAPSQIALLLAIGAAVELLFMVPGGWFKDHVGRIATLFLCLASFGGGYIILAFSNTFAGMLLGVLVISVGNGFGAGINMTIGADLSPARGKAKFLGLWAMFSGAAAVFGPGMVAALLALQSLQFVMFAVSATAFIAAIWSVVTKKITRLK